MSDSILISTKKTLSIPEGYTVFDDQIIMHINSVFSTLTQLGIGPKDGYEIEDAVATWDAFLLGNVKFNFVKTYVGLRVRKLFDPPGTSYHITAIDEQIKELEWRINAERESWSTSLMGGRKRVMGSQGDEYKIRLTNPPGTTLINATGTYEAEFISKDGTSKGYYPLDASSSEAGVLFLSAVIQDGTYHVRRLNPRRTILVIEVLAE